ncbi:MAG: AtpZ/AtpI family protein [Cytophagales bacterium]
MEQPNPLEKKSQPYNNFIRFSALGLQMAGTVAIFGWAGHWLDGHFNSEKPFFTLGFLLFGTIISILSLIRQLK